jgi:hypothetical protein
MYGQFFFGGKEAKKQKEIPYKSGADTKFSCHSDHQRWHAMAQNGWAHDGSKQLESTSSTATVWGHERGEIGRCSLNLRSGAIIKSNISSLNWSFYKANRRVSKITSMTFDNLPLTLSPPRL